MTDLTRRQILGGAAGGLIAATAADLHRTMEMGKIAQLPQSSGGCEAATPGRATITKFTDFSKYLKEYGDRALRGEARNIQGMDADLIEMRLPLATKVRMQIERNYRRLIADKKSWFAEAVAKKGFVEWWT